MKLPLSVLTAAVVLALAACSPTDTAPPAPATDAPAAAAEETQAFYGDEAPVAVPAVPADDHGHAHDEHGGHTHDAHGGHPHEDEHENGEHTHGDGSEPHDH
jgi:hypothetical protein